jgi:cephalosporin-C deacetylase-like acetyl esterase
MGLTICTTQEEREKMARAYDRLLAGMEAERRRQLDAEIAKLKTPDDVRAYQKAVRARLAQVLGDFPERTPLRARIVGRFDLPKVTVEKIVFESQPDYYVTANLYIPRRRPLPAPGILVPCGHLIPGKIGEYGNTGHCLALKGYVSMVFDPTGQGERSECLDPRTGRHRVALAVCQHHWTGKPCFLTDTTLAGYRTWDGIRCIDYLLTRKEIDPKRIGVVGNSGGGAMTTLISAVDERVAACAPVHPGGSMENTHLRGRRPPDRDIYSLMAPRPCRIIVGDQSKEEAGHRVKLDIMKPFYEAWGCPERLELKLVAGFHDLFKPKREAAYEWFNRWFGMESEGSEEPKFRRIAPKKLLCTTTGQVLTSIGGETMRSLNQARADKIAPRRAEPKSEQDLLKQQETLRNALQSRICFRRVTGPLQAKSLGITQEQGFSVERVVFESEPGMPVPALLLTPDPARPGAPVIVHACEEGKPQALDPATLPVLLARKGFRVLSIDARDTGEAALCLSPAFPAKSNGKLCAYNPQLWQRENLAIRSLWVGRSRSAMRALDIIRAGDLLKERGLLGDGFAVVGEGRLGIDALKAAAFDSRVRAVAAVRALASYRMITDNAYFNQFQHFWTPGALKDYDVPDLPALLSPRPAAFIAPVNHMTKPVGKAELLERFAWARSAYAAADRPGALVLAPARGLASIACKVTDLLGRGISIS